MKNETNPTEVLTFRRGDSLATVVTDGQTHQTYEPTKCTRHATLNRAIAYLEAQGYQIEIDKFNEDGLRITITKIQTR